MDSLGECGFHMYDLVRRIGEKKLLVRCHNCKKERTTVSMYALRNFDGIVAEQEE